MKTSELTGAALDWAVNQIEECCDDPFTPMFSTDWSQGGPIIEREQLNLSCLGNNKWEVWPNYGMNDTTYCKGPTPLIAAMRCYVASKLGDEVEVPHELD